MAKLNVFFYRPDRNSSIEVDWDLCYTANNKPYVEWAERQRIRNDIEAEKIKKKILNKPQRNRHYIQDYWR